MLNHFTFSIQIQRPKPPNWGLENNIWSCCCSFPGPGSKPATKYRLMHSAEKKRLILLPIGSTYAIYGNIYHQYTPNVGIYIPYMDPMGYNIPFRPFPHVGAAGDAAPTSEVSRPRRSCAPSRTNIGLLLSHFLTQSMKSRKRSKIVS
jgi:hypothetical protein